MQKAGNLRFRDGLLENYGDVLTPVALEALDALAPFDDDRRALMRARIERRAERARDRERIAFLDPRRRRSAARRSRSGRPRRPVRRQRDSRRTCSGSGFRAPARRRGRGRRRRKASATSPTRCSRAPTAGCSTARTRSARSTMSLDNQRNLKLAIHRDPVVPEGRRAGRRRDERTGRRGSSAGRSSPTGGSSSISPRKIFRAARTAPRRSARPARRRRRLLRVDRRPGAVRRRTTTTCCAPAARRLVLYLPKIQTAEEAALWNDMLDGARAASRAAARHDQGLRARRAARGVLPADGDPRRARRRTSSASTPAAGTTSTASRTRWRGIRRSSTRTSTPITMTYGYMRALRGPRAARRQHAGSAAAASRCGRAAWSRTSRSARRPASTASMKRAVAGAEREQREGASGKWVAHWKMVHIVRPVWEKVGEANQLGREFPPLTYTTDGRRRPDAARAGAAHDPRRARSAQRRAAVRQRVRPGLAGGGAQAGRLLRQRRRALPDGGHGDRRDPPEHPVGVAAQEAPLTADDDGRREGRATRSRRSCSRGCSTRSTRSCRRAGNRDVHDDSKETTLPIAREIVETYVARID